jgi:hypothetical protein
MKLYDTSNSYDSIYHLTLGLLGIPSTDTTTLPTSEFVRSANVWLRNAGEKIWQNQNYWEFDDTNHTDMAVATTDLVADQQDYALDTTVFDILDVEVKNENGDWKKIEPITNENRDYARQEFMKTAGMPSYYQLAGNMLSLYPKPAAGYVTTTSGLTIYVARDINGFDLTSTSMALEPGIPRQFHDYIGIGVAHDQTLRLGLSEKWQQVSMLLRGKEKEIKDHYSRRQKDIKTRIRPRNQGPQL